MTPRHISLLGTRPRSANVSSESRNQRSGSGSRRGSRGDGPRGRPDPRPTEGSSCPSSTGRLDAPLLPGSLCCGHRPEAREGQRGEPTSTGARSDLQGRTRPPGGQVRASQGATLSPPRATLQTLPQGLHASWVKGRPLTVLEVGGAEGLVSDTISWMASRSLSRCRALLMPTSRWISVSDRADMMAPLLTLARQAATYQAGIPTHSCGEDRRSLGPTPRRWATPQGKAGPRPRRQNKRRAGLRGGGAPDSACPLPV